MTYFNFLGEEMYYVSGKELVLIDLYTNERRVLPLSTAYNFALVNDDRMYGVMGKRVIIEMFRP